MNKKNKRKLITEWSDDLLTLAIAHVNDGRSMSSFAGRYGVPIETWQTWCREIRLLREINTFYKKRLFEERRFKDNYLSRGEDEKKLV